MPGLYTAFTSSVLFPLHERLKRHSTVAARKALEDSQWWPTERLAAFQVERLRALLTDAGRHVPYYRDLFARLAFVPTTVSSVADLQCLPLLTKAAIRAHTGAMN